MRLKRLHGLRLNCGAVFKFMYINVAQVRRHRKHNPRTNKSTGAFRMNLLFSNTFSLA